MRAPEVEERNDRIDVSRYAPRRYRMRTGAATAGPVLERLSRGLSDGGADAAPSAPPAAPIYIQDAPSSPRFPLSMTGRLAAAMGLVAVLAVGSVAFLQPKAQPPAPAASGDTTNATPRTAGMADLPKPVHTVTLRQDGPASGDAQAAIEHAPPAQSGASFAERVEAVGMKPAAPRPEAALALTAPLTLWALYPGDASAGERDLATVAANAEDGGNAKDATAARADVRQQQAKAANEARRQRYSQRRRTRAAAKPRQQQQAESAETQAGAGEPVKKLPLQAAIDALFGNGDDSGGSAPAGAASPTTGAAFR